ncbi:hypothetical protein CSE16_14065 [Solibacillus sp. R5-41]|uniref:hypothetical protein n=1 Tax=Solibacillus sp. R5-41 TaxID=2048654 RepID=UPI000C125905|nr:hypothetical protein [Solibacillus sp. R5-41]ATP41087.1 hypothetical protein CSE16_14065 [Solibacillus sp. R5-41]
MYYNYHPYYVNAQHYPMWMAVNQPSPSPLPQHTAMPTTNSPYPPVDTHKLKTSVKSMQSIMQQAQLLTTKIAASEQFSHDLMNAAQLSNKKEVDRLITSIGVTIQFETKFTPSGIEVRFFEIACCGLTVNLGW